MADQAGMMAVSRAVEALADDPAPPGAFVRGAYRRLRVGRGLPPAPVGVGGAGELGHYGSTGSFAIGVGYAQRHRGGGRKGAHLPGGWVNRSAMTHRAAGWLPMPKWLA